MEVHFAADGHSALRALAEGGFHLVLTDLYMPVMDGFALIQKMRADSKLRDIPVVAISGGGHGGRGARESRRCGGLPAEAGALRGGSGDGEAPSSDQLEFQSLRLTYPGNE